MTKDFSRQIEDEFSKFRPIFGFASGCRKSVVECFCVKFKDDGTIRKVIENCPDYSRCVGSCTTYSVDSGAHHLREFEIEFGGFKPPPCFSGGCKKSSKYGFCAHFKQTGVIGTIRENCPDYASCPGSSSTMNPRFQ